MQYVKTRCLNVIFRRNDVPLATRTSAAANVPVVSMWEAGGVRCVIFHTDCASKPAELRCS
jgi:hypothetical protein